MSDVQIDLLVPAALGGSGRRGARLGPHGTEVARTTTGLEPALVDHALHNIAALEPADGRRFNVAVAGVASLLIAKLHKIADRKDNADRRQDKDGLDVLRLLRFADTDHLAGTLTKLALHPIAGTASQDARTYLANLFGDSDAPGAQMAARATVGLEDELAIRISCAALARQLLGAWKP